MVSSKHTQKLPIKISDREWQNFTDGAIFFRHFLFKKKKATKIELTKLMILHLSSKIFNVPNLFCLCFPSHISFWADII